MKTLNSAYGGTDVLYGSATTRVEIKRIEIDDSEHLKANEHLNSYSLESESACRSPRLPTRTIFRVANSAALSIAFFLIAWLTSTLSFEITIGLAAGTFTGHGLAALEISRSIA